MECEYRFLRRPREENGGGIGGKKTCLVRKM
jgi:hypothetical protein